MSFIELRDVTKTFADGTRAVKGSTLDIEEGEFLVLLGPSGCGKTTTLRMIAGLETPTSGQILLGGADVTSLPPSRRDVGFVFQFYALYPHLSVRENILFPLRAIGMPRSERVERLASVADRLGIGPLLDQHPRQLSGGDQQRVSLARAMVRRPAVYLMDEPLGTLDADRRLEMREFIRSQQQELGVTTIYVTHDQEEAMSLADRIVVMHQGDICQTGTPVAVYDNPASLVVANFLGSPGMNFLRGEAVRRGDASVLVAADGAAEMPLPRVCADGPLTVGGRPEYVRIGAAGGVAGSVALDEYFGSCRIVYVETGFGRVAVRAPADQAVAVGEAVSLTIDPAHTVLFDPASGERLS